MQTRVIAIFESMQMISKNKRFVCPKKSSPAPITVTLVRYSTMTIINVDVKENINFNKKSLLEGESVRDGILEVCGIIAFIFLRVVCPTSSITKNTYSNKINIEAKS